MGDFIHSHCSIFEVIPSTLPTARLDRVGSFSHSAEATLIVYRFTFVYWTWSLGYKPFQKLGSDTILIVSPGGITIFTSSPEIIAQVGRRHKEFLKPTRLYKIVDAYAPVFPMMLHFETE